MAHHEALGDEPVISTTASGTNPPVEEPVDPDLDDAVTSAVRRRGRLHRRRRSHRRHGDVVMAVGVGGALGTLTRYGLEVAVPTNLHDFPWTTLGINLVGCLLLGVVLYIVFERRPPSRLLRPFLAIGVLGGFTTFSTFAVEIVQRTEDHPRTAALYLAVSVAGGPFAVLAGAALVRRIYALPSHTAERRSST